MTKAAVIFGFSYARISPSTSMSLILDGTRERDDLDYALPGIVVDLYLAYSHALSIGCDKILLVTDQSEFSLDRPILNLVRDGKIEAGIAKFCQDITHHECFHRFTNMDNLLSRLKRIGKDITRLFFYYSGHAHHGVAFIPRYRHAASYDLSPQSKQSLIQTVNFVDLLQPLVLSTATDCQIFCVMDCCNSNGLDLPYKLVNTVSWKNKSTTISLNNKNSLGMFCNLIDKEGLDYEAYDIKASYEMVTLTNWFFGRNIVCLSASSLIGKSYTSHSGSKFTTKVFSYLRDEEINTYSTLILLLNLDLLNIDDILPQIRSTHPMEYFIQPWIRSKSNLAIEYDKLTRTLIVRN
jgi:hypothetical protein